MSWVQAAEYKALIGGILYRNVPQPIVGILSCVSALASIRSLSQWRAYRGGGGGYAIGFDFFHLLRVLGRPCVLRRVVYEENEQMGLIDSAINEFLTVLQAEIENQSAKQVAGSFLPALCHAFRSTIGEFFFCFKHPDFKEEREWRLVHFASVNPISDRSSDVPRFRSYD